MKIELFAIVAANFGTQGVCQHKKPSLVLSRSRQLLRLNIEQSLYTSLSHSRLDVATQAWETATFGPDKSFKHEEFQRQCDNNLVSSVTIGALPHIEARLGASNHALGCSLTIPFGIVDARA